MRFFGYTGIIRIMQRIFLLTRYDLNPAHAVFTCYWYTQKMQV